MSTQDKKVKIVIDTDFNNNKIINAKIDADENELIGIGKIDDVQVNGESVVEGQVANISMATVAISGSYTDLTNKPIIPDPQVNSDWNSDSGVSEILNKPALTTVALTGDYNDLINKPVVGNATLTIQKNSSNIGTFTANATVNNTINVEVPTSTNDLINDSDFQTSEDVNSAISLHNSSNTAHSDIRQDISSIDELIPAQASSTNKLADKNFVNSSIATNTANFIGTFNSVAELEAYSGPVTNNDYAFVISEDESGNTSYDRYKYNSSEAEWLYEYTLNNSSFTSNQWAAINSGITTSKVTNYDNHLSNTDNPHSVTKEQVGLGNVDNTSDLSKPISTATQNALNAKQDTLTTQTAYTSKGTATKVPQITTNTLGQVTGITEVDISHQDIKTLNTDNTTGQTASSSEAIAGSGTINLHKVSKTGSYNDLLNTPTIPTVNDSTITITQDGTTKGTFTLNQSTNATINLDAGNVEDVQVNGDSVVESGIASINLKTINNQDIIGEGNLEIQGGSNLNEFVITKEIFDEYKNENDYADLADIIDSEEITQNVINLNNFNYFLTGLVVSNKTLLFKNGTIVLGTSGINDSIDKAITSSNCKLGFKDCEIIVNDSITTEPEKPIIDLNNTDLTFDNVIADNFTFTTFKTFIQTTNTCNIVLKDTLFDIIDKLINYDPEEDEKRPSMKFIKVLTNGSSVKFINSMVGISTENLIGDDINPGLCQNIIVETIGLATVKLEILNSILQLRAEGGHGEGGISSRPPRCLDINLDNLDVTLIDSLMSCFNSDGFNVRPESSYGLEPNKSFTTNDPYMVFFEPSIDIFQGDDEAEDYEPKFENINIDKYLFIDTVEYIEGDYHFTYNGSSWDVTANSFDEDDTITRTLDTNITIEQIEEKYGLTFNLIEGKVLEQDDDITLELVLDSSYYKILENFTVESNSEEYLNELNYNIGEVIDLAEEIETVNYDNEKFANALAEVLERNEKHLKPHSEYDEEHDIETPIMAKIGFWYDEDNGDPNVWKIEIDPEWIEEDRHLMDDVDLRDFGLEVIIKDGQEIHNLSGFTVVVEPKVESTTVSIKENTNSVITGNPFEEDFPWLENKQPLRMFSTELVGFSQVKSIQAENIKTNNISVSDEYYLPVRNENLESDNVRDAINELADKGTLSEENAGFSISIHGEHGRSGDKIYYDGLDIEFDSWGVGDDNMFAPGDEIDFNETHMNVTEGTLIFRNGQLIDLDDYVIDNNVVTFNTELQEGDIVSLLNGWNIFKKITGFIGTELEIDFNFEQRVLIFKNGILLSQDNEEDEEHKDYYFQDGKLIFTTALNEDDKLTFIRVNGFIDRREYHNGETQIFIDRDDILLFRDGILQGQSYEDEEGQLPENYDYVIKDNPNYHEDRLINNAEFMNDNKIELEAGTITPVDENERIIFIAVDDEISEGKIDKILIKITKHEQEDDEPITIFEKRLSEFEDYEHEEEGPNILFYIQVKDLDINELLPEGNYSFTLEGIYEDEEAEDEESFRIEFNTSLEDGNIIFNSESYSINEPYMIQFQDALDNCNLTILDKGISGGIFNTLSDKQDKLTEKQLNNINNPYKPLIFNNIEANDWIEDDTFEDYGYKCELECEGVNENMFAQVVFSIDEANSGNYASVCDTEENKVIIYSKVNDTITIPTIVIMEA